MRVRIGPFRRRLHPSFDRTAPAVRGYDFAAYGPLDLLVGRNVRCGSRVRGSCVRCAARRVVWHPWARGLRGSGGWAPRSGRVVLEGPNGCRHDRPRPRSGPSSVGERRPGICDERGVVHRLQDDDECLGPVRARTDHGRDSRGFRLDGWLSADRGGVSRRSERLRHRRLTGACPLEPRPYCGEGFREPSQCCLT